MNSNIQFKKTLLSALVAGICAPSAIYAAPLNISQFPPGNLSVTPAPNILLMLDNSYKMDLPLNAALGPETRLTSVKKAVTAVFGDPALIPDGKIRLIWGVSADRDENGMSYTNIWPKGPGSMMSPWNQTRRTLLLDYVNNIKTDSGLDIDVIPARMLNVLRSGAININSPWAYNPGVQTNPVLGCRRSYGIVLSDGQSDHNWLSDPTGSSYPALPNGRDGTSRTLPGPDFKYYDITSPETRVYRDTSPNTVSDHAFFGWAADLRPDIPNEIVPSTNDGVPEVENIGGVNISRYWNPKHNPARWQHLVMYTLGFNSRPVYWAKGAQAHVATGPNGLNYYTDWFGGTPVAPFWDSVNNDMYGGDFPNLVNGSVVWPQVTAPLTPPLMSFSEEEGLRSLDAVNLWHMAINSRGKYYPLGPGSNFTVEDALRDIVVKINRDNLPSATGSAGTASTNIRSGLNVYGAGYVPERWSGYVQSNKLDTAGNVTSNTDWGITAGIPNTTASLLDARNVGTRVVLTTNDQAPNTGVSFEWDAGTTKLSAAQKALLNVDGKGQDRVNFLRGDRAKENGTAFRVRDSRQGDIVNSGIWYVDAPVSNYAFGGYKAFSSAQRNRLPMIYVGGNDGMLHGFSAVNGEEQIAYVPKGVVADLPPLSAPSYAHRYFVDGSPFTGDLKVGTGDTKDDWRTYLVGTLAAGGKGYFVLNVTEPGNKSGTTASTFTTSNAATLVVLDRTLNAADPVAAASADADIGHIFASPVLDESNPFKATQITKLNDDRWAVVMGNGYNSKNERPVLLIQYLDSTNEVNGVKELKRIVATGTQVPSTPVALADANVVGNGLSAPRLVDINSDGRVDMVYAGDLKGNLWKFDLTSKTAADWGVAGWGVSAATPCTTGICTPLYTASHLGKRQGITAAPSVKANDRGAGGLMVAFGTGVNFNDDDGRSTDVQSVYSVLDNTRYKLDSGGTLVKVNTTIVANTDGIGAIPAVVVISDLVQQDLSSATAIAGQGKSLAREFWTMTQNSVKYADPDPDALLKKGWYFNLPESRERVLKPMSFFDGSNNLMVFSSAPAFTGTATGEESCTPSGTNEKAYLTLMNIMDGKKPSVQVMDANGDGFYNSAVGKDDGVSRMTTSQGSISSVTGKKKITLNGRDGKPDNLAPMPEQAMRPSWRQLQ